MGTEVGLWSRMFSAGVRVVFSKLLVSGVGVEFSKMLESESVLKKCGVGVDFLNLNNLWDGVGVGILKNLPTPQPCPEVPQCMLCAFILLSVGAVLGEVI